MYPFPLATLCSQSGRVGTGVGTQVEPHPGCGGVANSPTETGSALLSLTRSSSPTATTRPPPVVTVPGDPHPETTSPGVTQTWGRSDGSRRGKTSPSEGHEWSPGSRGGKRVLRANMSSRIGPGPEGSFSDSVFDRNTGPTSRSLPGQIPGFRPTSSGGSEDVVPWTGDTGIGWSTSESLHL